MTGTALRFGSENRNAPVLKIDRSIQISRKIPVAGYRGSAHETTENTMDRAQRPWEVHETNQPK
jgi:hypothetical protein